MNTLTLGIDFDRKRYDDNLICHNDYYLELTKQGINLATKLKNIPYNELNEMADILAHNHLCYKWQFKNLILSEDHIKIKFACQLSTKDFIMTADIVDSDTKTLIGSGVVLRTKPDEIFFSIISKKIFSYDRKVVIPSKWGTPLIYLRLCDLKKGTILPHDCESPFPDDKQATLNFKHLQQELHYHNNDFI